MLEKQIIHSVPFISFKFFYKNGGFGGMLSKNNKKLQAQKMEPKQQRFAIKKFTVGVASVLIGTTFAPFQTRWKLLLQMLMACHLDGIHPGNAIITMPAVADRKSVV